MRRLRTMLWVAVVFIGVECVAFGAPQHKKEKEPEVDHLALASLMLKDGHYDRAATVLSEIVRKEQGEDFDLPRYYMIFGLVQLERHEHGAAKKSFEKSIEAGQTEPVVHVFLAQALFGLQDYAGVVEELDRAKGAAEDLPGAFMIRAQAHYKMDDRPVAFRALERGLKRHPGDLELLRFRVLLLVDMELFQQAVVEGRAYLDREEVKREDYAVVCEAFIKGGDPDSAVLLLEEARLRYVEDVDIALQLARAYLKMGRILTAARLFHSVARADVGMVLDAAELYRRAGKLSMALSLNADVAAQDAKVRQRLGILIEMGRFEEAAALEPRLTRLGLLEENSVRYALAFALFKTGRFDRVERHLELIRDPALFEKAVELRRAMDLCRASGWECE